MRGRGTGSSVVARHAGWHLSSIGNATEFVRKVTTFGAANMFDPATPGMLDEARIGACLARDPGDRPSAAEALNWPGAWVELDDEA